ncbi:decarboxylating NADP(+)-dependent phosphogluconate dehydrogenase [Lentisphaera profundi]|uniref:6-phosphogluconate dehydrogenase, decarboxylating n=1 Tax=Lentisphaera profundi TaxID=1658616 RepID=A0ABY7VVT0_9BACT|nr:decarboxylating NADP(+)-dependent phosphogluconate dehydrogenase [Lentisphaera profundi]WDE98330.1 decarboxylating NADP(+)-dependent phosphogluconate dehydrogenase [Lentisphaera profundi]
MSQADIGLIGLAVMGQNLVMNMNDHGYTVAVYNRTTSKVDDFMNGPAKGSNVIGTHSVEEFVATLKTPRRVMLMVKAGEVVDKFINTIVPHLDKGDIIIDGGNSLYTDSNRRVEELSAKGLRYIGAGVSGGEEGARFGPSIMPGGDPEAWPAVKNIFQDISAKVDGGEACCEWVGKGGAGHYVKMVHNGIEYGDMQLICEAYQLLKNAGFSNDEMHEIFKKWNTGVLDSFLTEITTDILGYKQEDGTHLVDYILDTAGQKGTGKWTGINALDLGMPLTLIAESVFARCVSALKDQRIIASKVLQGPGVKFNGDKEAFVNDVEQALYASKIISYAQGYMLLREASETYKWDLDFGAIALMWRGGCIIRSVFLGNIKEAFEQDPDLDNLLLNDFFKDAIHMAQAGWRRTVIKSIEIGVPTPCFSTALSFYDSYRTEVLPANLLQAQRDYFGAHTYERLDKPRGEFFHTNWTGKGGDISSTTYDV